MQFLAENLPQHFGGDGPVVLSQRGTQNFIHKRLIATAGERQLKDCESSSGQGIDLQIPVAIELMVGRAAPWIATKSPMQNPAQCSETKLPFMRLSDGLSTAAPFRRLPADASTDPAPAFSRSQTLSLSEAAPATPMHLFRSAWRGAEPARDRARHRQRSLRGQRQPSPSGRRRRPSWQ
jgi:hypothetical protein